MAWIPVYRVREITYIDTKTPGLCELLNQSDGYPLSINGMTFSTVWHMYYAMLFDDQKVQKIISDTPQHSTAKRIALVHQDKLTVTDPEYQYMLMSWCVRYKFYTYPQLSKHLTSIADGKPICYVNKEDVKWGCITNTKVKEHVCGMNELGYILQQIRREVLAGNVSMFIYDRYIVNNEIVSQPMKKLVEKQKQ